MFENIMKKDKILNIWKKRQMKESLNEHEKLMIKVMEAHSEYHDFFNKKNIYEILNDWGGEDPFFHLILHWVLEEQIKNNNPPEVSVAFNHLMQKSRDGHRVMHSLGIVLADELNEMLKSNGKFNDERYRERIAGFMEI